MITLLKRLKRFKSPYYRYNEAEGYPNIWTDDGIVNINDENWKFIMRTKCKRNPIWTLINENNEIVEIASNDLDKILTVKID